LHQFNCTRQANEKKIIGGIMKKLKLLVFVLVVSVMVMGSLGHLYSQNKNFTLKSKAKPTIKLLPDLTIGKVDFFEKDVFKVRVQVYNKGLAPSTACILKLKIGCGLFKTVTVPIPALKETKPGAWPDLKSQITVELKSPLPFINSLAILTIDAAKKVKESKEDNNTWQKNNCVK
jgi:hypothetical protein